MFIEVSGVCSTSAAAVKCIRNHSPLKHQSHYHHQHEQSFSRLQLSGRNQLHTEKYHKLLQGCCLNNASLNTIVVIREQHCWTNNIVHPCFNNILVSNYCSWNNGNRKILYWYNKHVHYCWHACANLLTSYYSNDDWTMLNNLVTTLLSWLGNIVDNVHADHAQRCSQR